MRAVVQRVLEASVTVDGEIVGAISQGLCVLVGAADGDVNDDADYIARKLCDMRIFEDKDGKMNLSVADVGGKILIISQFTLLGDARKGRRPSFVKALEPRAAHQLVDYLVSVVKGFGVSVETGVFAADMKVSLVNDGPVTILLDSAKTF